MPPRTPLIAALLSAMLAAPLAAQDFDAGREAAAAGDFETALANWRPLAEEGDLAAQYNLGMMHARGDGVPQDFAAAAAWFTRAAEQGHVEAQARIGAMYVRGIGVEQDHAAGAEWLRKAAEKHHAQSQYDLGVLYANGQGVEQDLGRAYFWFTIAGFQNFYPAREAQQQMRGMISPGQVGYVEQQVRDWLSREAGMEFQRMPDS